MTCKTPTVPGSLAWCSGQMAAPGIKLRIFYIPKRDIVAWPALPAFDAVAAATLGVMSGKFTLAADSVWHSIRIDQKKSTVNSETQGEAPFSTCLDKGSFVHPGTDEEAAAFTRQAINDDYVYLFEQVNGKFRLIGNETYETITKVGTNIGQVGGTDKGTTIEVECTSESPLPFYTGEIVTADGTINEAPKPS